MLPPVPPRRVSARKKVLSSLVATTLAAGMILPAAPVLAATTFSDVPVEYWAYSYIMSLADKGIVNGFGDQFKPGDSVTRAQFAKMLVKSLNLQMIRPATPTFTDVSPQSWEYEYVETAYKNGLLNGVGDNQFQPASLITRQDMAKMTVSSLPVPLQNIRSDIRSNLTFADRTSIAVYAKEYVAVGSYIGLISGQPGNLFAPLGNATRAEASAIVDRFGKLTPEQISSLTTTTSLKVVSPSTSFTAGTNAFLNVQVVNQNGEVLTGDSGRKITIQVSQPIPKDPSDNYTPKTSTLTASTQNGIAQFNIPVTTAGLYRVQTSSDGLSSVAGTTFTVVHAKAEKLYVAAKSSPFLLPGSTASITVQAVDHYNNLANDVSGVPVSISLAGQGTLSQTSAVLSNGTASFGSFTASTTPGNVQLNAVSNGTLAADSYTVSVVKDKSQMVAGKGMWLMWRDWYNQDTDALLAEAKKRGVTHLYMHVATTTDGIFALDALDDLLPAAHRNNIKVIGWVYSDLRNPLSDAQRDIKVAQYVTPSGDKIDALTTDIEDAVGTTEANVTTYSQAVRNAIGTNYPFYACTYPPSMRPSYPWKVFGTYYDVIIPMDYWHFKYKTYTKDEAYNFVVQSIKDIHSLTGRPDMPISIAGQGYDMFTDDSGQNSPTADEIQGAMQGAKDAGALGFSMYRWGTMNTAQWDTFGSFLW